VGDDLERLTAAIGLVGSRGGARPGAVQRDSDPDTRMRRGRRVELARYEDVAGAGDNVMEPADGAVCCSSTTPSADSSRPTIDFTVRLWLSQVAIVVG